MSIVHLLDLVFLLSLSKLLVTQPHVIAAQGRAAALTINNIK